MSPSNYIIGYFVCAVITFVLFWVYYIAKYQIDSYPVTREFKEIVDYIFDGVDDKISASFIFSLIWPISISLIALLLSVLILVFIGTLLGIWVSKGFIWFRKREEKELED